MASAERMGLGRVLAPPSGGRDVWEVGLSLNGVFGRLTGSASPTADPPVCKITDYGKYLYQTNKKAHEQRKHQKGSQLKEVKFRPATAEHDYQVRKNQIIRFLGEGHKVKAMIFHRGREMAHQEVGRAKMNRLLQEIADHALVEIGPRMEANIMMALLAPKKGGSAKAPAAASGGQA